jgi:hypothetical protein
MPVLNLEKPGRFKKGGTAMKKPVAKKKGGTTAKSSLPAHYYEDQGPSPRTSRGDDITRDNERFLAGKIANEVMKLFADEPTKEQIEKIQGENTPNFFLETIRKGLGITKKARGGTVQKSSAVKKPVAKKKGGMAFKTCRGCPTPAKCKAAGKCLKTK